eukprot:308498-Amphidinium_carterae.1
MCTSEESLLAIVGSQSVQLGLMFPAWRCHFPHEETDCLLKLWPITRVAAQDLNVPLRRDHVFRTG